MADAASRKRGRAADKIVPLRASLVALKGQLKAFKQATIEDTDRGRRSSPINNSPIAKDIDLIFKAIAEEGGLKPYELAFSIDTADMSNPAIKDLSKEIDGVRTALLTHMRHRARFYGLSTSYVQNKQKTKILIMGPEL